VKIKRLGHKASTVRAIFIAFGFFFTFCCLMPAMVFAHKVNIYAYAESGMVFSEGYFVDGTKCKYSLIEVFDGKNGTKLLKGETDKEGRFSFKIPKATSLKLVLHASMGHRAEYAIGEDEVRDAMGVRETPKPPATKVTSKPEVSTVVNTQQKESSEISVLKGLSESDIEVIVENVVDRKLKPIERMLVTLQKRLKKPGVTEIIGGIGYILGIFGIIMYFKSRKKI
jgi:nickel transport protein